MGIRTIEADMLSRTRLVLGGTKGLGKEIAKVYAATKHAQVGFARSLALENGSSDIKISLVLPGGMQTPFWDGHEVPDFNTFLDPMKVASLIVEKIMGQAEPYQELEIPRGSL